jgi:undecaprenyl-diphosphatase
MNIWNSLAQLDKELFTLINVKGALPALDEFMKAMRNANTWILLYAFILYYILRYARKYAWQFVIFSIITFALTDFTSASIIKPLIARPRPCFDNDLKPVIRSLVDCGGIFSMPSSHASNHFGLAAFWFWSIRLIRRKNWWWLWLWAFGIGYAQIYVGKHYPFDIIVGATLGMLAGSFTYWLFKKLILAKNTTVLS